MGQLLVANVTLGLGEEVLCEVEVQKGAIVLTRSLSSARLDNRSLQQRIVEPDRAGGDGRPAEVSDRPRAPSLPHLRGEGRVREELPDS